MSARPENEVVWYALLMGLAAESNRAHLQGRPEEGQRLEEARARIEVEGERLGWSTVEACKTVLTSMANKNAS